MTLLSVADLVVHFKTPQGPARAVDGISFDIEAGQTVALVGESGCGKSVTALTILRLLQEKSLHQLSGRIDFDGQNLLALSQKQIMKIRGKKIGLIFQEPMTALNPVLTVGRQLSEGLRLHLALGAEKARSRGLDMLKKVGIDTPESVWDAYPGQLSGGMRQRVMIAIVVSTSPDLLIADEPTTALDVTIQTQVLDLIHRMRNDTGAGVLLITHDLGVVAEVADRVCVMYAGRIVESAPVKTLFDRPLHPYTKGLLKSVESLDQGRLEIAITGQIARATNYPPGCRFHPRCPHRFEPCDKVQPIPVISKGCAVSCHLFESIEN